jgi:hypothetical protein
MIKYETKDASEIVVLDNLLNAITGTSAQCDLIDAAKQYIASIDEGVAINEMGRWIEIRGYAAFLLGGVLSVIAENSWQNSLGYSSFDKMIETETGLARSTAYEYRRVYNDITSSGIAWKEVEFLGWSKIRVISNLLAADSKDEWIDLAKELTVQQLKERVKKAKHLTAHNAQKPKYLPDTESEASTHVDRVIDSSALPTEGPTAVKPLPSVPVEAAMSSKESTAFSFYPDQAKVVFEAIDRAKEELPTDYNNEALASIGTLYLQDPCV